MKEFRSINFMGCCFKNDSKNIFAFIRLNIENNLQAYNLVYNLRCSIIQRLSFIKKSVFLTLSTHLNFWLHFLGSRIITVRTKDEEKDTIVYGIEPAVFLDGSNYFTINPNNGDVFLKESLKGQVRTDDFCLKTNLTNFPKLKNLL